MDSKLENGLKLKNGQLTFVAEFLGGCKMAPTFLFFWARGIAHRLTQSAPMLLMGSTHPTFESWVPRTPPLNHVFHAPHLWIMGFTHPHLRNHTPQVLPNALARVEVSMEPLLVVSPPHDVYVWSHHIATVTHPDSDYQCILTALWVTEALLTMAMPLGR